jgi:hypothetical protein
MQHRTPILNSENTKAKAKKKINIIKGLETGTHHMTSRPRKPIESTPNDKMIVLGTLRYKEEAYGSATESEQKKLEPTHNRGIRLGL